MLARSLDHVLELVRAGDLHAASGWAWIRGLCDGRWHRNRSRSCSRIRRRENNSISNGIYFLGSLCFRRDRSASGGRPIR